MKKYRIPIVVIGLALQLLVFFVMLMRTPYWNPMYLYFTICAVVASVYLAFIDRGSSLTRFSMEYVVLIVVAIVLSAVVAQLEVMAIVWFIAAGISVALLAGSLTYHIVRVIIPGGTENKGLGFAYVVSCTVFSLCSYPLFLIMPMTVLHAVLALAIGAVCALIAAYALAYSLKQEQRTIISGICEWQRIDVSPVLQVALLNELGDALKRFLEAVQSKLRSLRDMGGDIKESSEDLSSVSEQMNASLEEVSSTIQQISKGAQEQSSSITTIAQSIEGLNALTSSISSQVKMASLSSRRSSDTAKQGMELARKEAKISKDIFEQTRFIEDKMNELRDQSTEIKKILDIIAGINEQTDLLALNAAIEAARVGEQGKGFAVVADEIRNLANETKRSSAVVESLIAEIGKTIQELSNLLASERRKMTESNVLAAETEQQFTGIVKAVDLLSDMISRINKAAGDQTHSTKELVKQVEQIAQVAADTAAATEEVSAAVQEQTASMQEFTSTAQLLAGFAQKLDELLAVIKE
jgi:methyl-accepting chemotaxis protein